MKPGDSWILDAGELGYTLYKHGITCNDRDRGFAINRVPIAPGDVITFIGFVSPCTCNVRLWMYDQIAAFLTPRGIGTEHFSTADGKLWQQTTFDGRFRKL